MKKLFEIFYGWAVPGLSSVLAPYKANEQMTNLVKTFYLKLQSYSLLFILIAVILSVLMFAIYYWPYNSKPGRHYRWQKWLMFLGITAVCAFVITFCIGASIKCPISSLWWRSIATIAGVNALYVIVFYLFLSFVLCQMPPASTKTNAYLWMKIGRK